MIFHGYYADMSDAEVDAFVQAQRMGRLVTVGTDGTPHIGKHQPEGGFRRPSADDPMYTGALGQLAALRLTISRRRVKFKLAQNRPPEVRRGLIGELCKRGAPGDAAAADALQWTIDRTPPRGN